MEKLENLRIDLDLTEHCGAVFDHSKDNLACWFYMMLLARRSLPLKP